MGGRMDYYDNHLYIVGNFDDKPGIYKLSLDNETVEIVVELDSWWVGDLHVTEEGIYFVDRNDDNKHIFNFYSFADEKIEVIAEGFIRHPQMADGKIWMMMEQTYPEHVEGDLLFTYDITTKELKDYPFGMVQITVTDYYKVLQTEIFLHEFTLEKTGDLLVENAEGHAIIDGDYLFYKKFDGLYSYHFPTGEIKQHITKPVEFFNVKNGHIFYTPQFQATVEQESYYASVKDGINERLEDKAFDEYYMFEDFMIGTWGRQGVVVYEKFDYESGEWSTIYYENPVTSCFFSECE